MRRMLSAVIVLLYCIVSQVQTMFIIRDYIACALAVCSQRAFILAAAV